MTIQLSQPSIDSNGKSFHQRCFVCKTCRTPLSSSFAFANNALYCKPCHKAAHLPSCGRCQTPIESRSVRALNKEWHEACWTCTTCASPFDGAPYFTLEDAPYCQKHYEALLAMICAACGKVIRSGPSVQVAAGKFHVACFTCSMCGSKLPRGTQFEDTKIGALCTACSTNHRTSIHVSAMTDGPLSKRNSSSKRPKSKAKTKSKASSSSSSSNQQQGGKRRRVRASPSSSSAFALAAGGHPDVAPFRLASLDAISAATSGMTAVKGAILDLLPSIVPSSSDTLIPATLAIIRSLKTTLDAMEASGSSHPEGAPFNVSPATRTATAVLANAKTAVQSDGNPDAYAAFRAAVSSLEKMTTTLSVAFHLWKSRAFQLHVLATFLDPNAPASTLIAWNAVGRLAASSSPSAPPIPPGFLTDVVGGSALPRPLSGVAVSYHPYRSVTKETFTLGGGKNSVLEDPTTIEVFMAASGEPSSFAAYAEMYLIPYADLEEQAYVRQEVIFEIMTSEAQFVTDLEILIQFFVRPLMASAPAIVDQDLASTLFSNVEDLLLLHQELLASLQGRQLSVARVDVVADVFVPLIRRMADLYSVYCGNHPRAVGALTRALSSKAGAKLEAFLDEVNGISVIRRLDLETYLVKPVQRLCKYPLLLRELLKATPSDHPDATSLQKIYALLDAVVKNVNSNKKVADAQRRLEATLASIQGSDAIPLSDSPLVVQDGLLIKRTGAKKAETRMVVLLDTCILWAKKKGALSSNRKQVPYTLRKFLALSAAIPEDIKDTETMSNAFRVRGLEKSYIWVAPSHKEKMEWLLNLSEARNKFLARHNMLPLGESGGGRSLYASLHDQNMNAAGPSRTS